MGDNEELATALRDAARALTNNHSIRDLDQTLTEIVAAAVSTVDGADAGGISMTTEEGVTSRNPTTEMVTKLDGLQSELGEGPCITAMQTPPRDGTVVVRDLTGDDAARWPRFAPQAVDAGYRSMLSCELHTGDQTRAALNLYAAEPHAFNSDARLTAALFSVQAAMLLYGSEQAQHLQRAIDSRDLIGQAKGILIERFGIDSDQAFQMLVSSSQDTNVKLVDVATWLLAEATGRTADGDEGPARRRSLTAHVRGFPQNPRRGPAWAATAPRSVSSASRSSTTCSPRARSRWRTCPGGRLPRAADQGFRRSGAGARPQPSGTLLAADSPCRSHSGTDTEAGMSPDKQRVVTVEEARRTAERATAQAEAARQLQARASELVQATKRRIHRSSTRHPDIRAVDAEQSSGDSSAS